ncbi:MAG: hypothetical protein M1486_03000 [Gammaproteobacteria bacterium]|nr:hypothetical protein [Gammaproteobacteria bacterium]
MHFTCLEKEAIHHLEQFFSKNELIELVAYCSFISASHKFGACHVPLQVTEEIILIWWSFA